MDCQPGDRVCIARIGDQDQDFLQFIDRSGLKPGAVITITTLDRIADAVAVRHAEPPSTSEPSEIQMGRLAASKIFVEPTRQ